MEHFKRIRSAVVVLPPLLLFLYYAPRPMFFLLVALLVALCLREYGHLLAYAQLPAHIGASYAVALGLVGAAAVGGEPYLAGGTWLGMFALAVTVLGTPRHGSKRLPALVYSMFGVLFIGWNLSYLILLRNLPEGKWFIFFLCIVVWIGDSVAMYVGQGFGHRKLAPSISPGKTWEGAIGGTLASVLSAGLVASVLLPQFELWQPFVLGLVIALTAQVSDLSESLIKRYTGVKDSGELIPGHGGMLDRVDSLLFASPCLFYTLKILLPTPTP